MKHNYNIKFNQEEPSDEQIRSHMDFDALLKKAAENQEDAPPKEAKRVSFFPRALAGSAIAATLAGVVFFTQFNSNQTDYNTIANTYFKDQPYINPPFEGVTPQFSSYNLSADKGGSLTMEGNANINVPPSAFLDENGNTISGNVNIKYRTLKSSGEYFSSGIPMFYDSLENRYAFEAIRVFEIYAEKDGQRLEVDPEKGVEIAFETKEYTNINKKKPVSYNIYQLLENQKNWMYKGQSNSIFKPQPTNPSKNYTQQTIENKYLNKIAALDADYQKQVSEINKNFIVPSLPVEPVRFDPDRITFDLDFNVELSKDYSEFKNLKWQPKGNDQTLQNIAKIEWYDDEISLRKVNDGLYKMKFENSQNSIEIDAIPVLSGPEFQAALEEYNRKLTSTEAEIKRVEEEKINALAALNAQLEADKQNLSDQKAEEITQLSSDGHSSTEQILDRAVRNVFTINELGIWNCDRIVESNAVKTKVTCSDSKGELYINTTLYHADLEKNILNKYYLGEFAEIMYNSSSQNQFWVVTQNGNLAVAYPEEINEVDNIILKVNPQEVKSEKDIYEILRLGKAF